MEQHLLAGRLRPQLQIARMELIPFDQWGVGIVNQLHSTDPLHFDLKLCMDGLKAILFCAQLSQFSYSSSIPFLHIQLVGSNY